MKIKLGLLALAFGLSMAEPFAGTAWGQEKVEIIRGMPSNATMRELSRADKPKSARPKIKGKFRELDRNRDGKISRDEIEADNARRIQHFERIDKNGDGAVNAQEWREARAYRSRKSKQRTSL